MKRTISTAIVFVPLDPKTGDFETELNRIAKNAFDKEPAVSEPGEAQQVPPAWTWFIDNPRPSSLPADYSK